MTFFQMPVIPYRPDVDNIIQVVSSDSMSKKCNATINKSLEQYLTGLKTEIDNRQTDWDRCKKYTNPYEFIHSLIPKTQTSVSKLKPLSRSYYKMIEIYYLFELAVLLPPVCNTFHIAEGPGGFIEAMCDLRKKNKDKYIGITLIDDCNYSIPGWKKSNVFLKKHSNVYIEKGKTETGDITSDVNLKYCYEKYGGKIDFVTADGGFDFSVHFNKQESMSAKLIFSQIAFAISVQKKGGIFLIKLFDTFTQVSIDMIFLLSLVYDEVYLVKPHSSRYANSEKYIVCKNFRLEKNEQSLLVKSFFQAFQEKNFKQTDIIVSVLNIKVPYFYSSKIEEYNAIYGQQQIETISSTLNLMNSDDKKVIENIKRANLRKCVSWCKKHEIPYNNLIES